MNGNIPCKFLTYALCYLILIRIVKFCSGSVWPGPIGARPWLQLTPRDTIAAPLHTSEISTFGIRIFHTPIPIPSYNSMENTGTGIAPPVVVPSFALVSGQYSDSESEQGEAEDISEQGSITSVTAAGAALEVGQSPSSAGVVIRKSLLQDTGSSGLSADSDGDSSSSADDGGSEDTSEDPEDKRRSRMTLLNPFSRTAGGAAASSATSTNQSVFNVPFRDNEELQSALLQRHVRLTPNTKLQTELNGKKICWSHRKGRCRFGHKCNFAHDSDLAHLQKKEADGTIPSNPADPTTETGAPNQEKDWNARSDKSRKRPGLSQTLIPGKRVMSQYYKK